ncbi:hypothetical protein CYLTODRAFT_427406 [Cylindrobasidium torrendii FP15055 ss-10]|uniref:F-box domain-containing protein n=1 Tax=Cylindrobasidium torrendii FP15055 ss-10 TaxID=1314674 RepID=A0A0D7AV29_9AGAR|nr:hypothetical protein CYLTODRAFT_427406 [Cylindrobasidium torrendii FP15055 ss-10]
MATFADLSKDVARYILEYVARTDSSAAHALVSVSRDVRAWIIPIRYHSVVLVGRSSVAQFERTLTRDARALGKHVRFIDFQQGEDWQDAKKIPAAQVKRILGACTTLSSVRFFNLDHFRFSATACKNLTCLSLPELQNTIINCLPKTLEHLAVRTLSDDHGDEPSGLTDEEFSLVCRRCVALRTLIIEEMTFFSVLTFGPFRSVAEGKHVRFIIRSHVTDEEEIDSLLFELVLEFENSVIVPLRQPSQSLAEKLKFSEGERYHGKIYMGSIEEGDEWTLGPAREGGPSLVERVEGWLTGL